MIKINNLKINGTFDYTIVHRHLVEQTTEFDKYCITRFLLNNLYVTVKHDTIVAMWTQQAE